jgi:hypothetical protein
MMVNFRAIVAATTLVALPAYASTPLPQSTFAGDTAVRAAKAADDDNCPKSMQIVAADLRDARFAMLPPKMRGEMLTIWARCAQQMSMQSLRSRQQM